MPAADERMSNKGLLKFREFTKKTDSVYSIVDAIAVERPLRNGEEASAAACYVNNVLAFVEYGVVNKESYPTDHQMEPVLEGIGEILKACRLVSLRVEQFVDIHLNNGNDLQLNKEK